MGFEPAFPTRNDDKYFHGISKINFLAPQAPAIPSWFKTPDFEGKPEQPEKSFDYRRKKHYGVMSHDRMHVYSPPPSLINSKEYYMAPDGEEYQFFKPIKGEEEFEEEIGPESHLWDKIMFDEKQLSGYNNEQTVWYDFNTLNRQIKWGEYWAKCIIAGKPLPLEKEQEKPRNTNE